MEVDCKVLVLFGAREAGCFELWLHYTVTILDRFHCTHSCLGRGWGKLFAALIVCMLCSVPAESNGDTHTLCSQRNALFVAPLPVVGEDSRLCGYSGAGDTILSTSSV